MASDLMIINVAEFDTQRVTSVNESQVYCVWIMYYTSYSIIWLEFEKEIPIEKS